MFSVAPQTARPRKEPGGSEPRCAWNVSSSFARSFPSMWQNDCPRMSRRLNYRVLASAVLILILAGIEIARERRPSFLRPGLRLYAFVANAGDGTVSVIDLVRVRRIATIAVGPSPSGLRAHPKFNQIWGVSTEGGYAFAIDSANGQILARIPVGSSPYALDFSADGNRAYITASGSATLVAIDCRTGQIVGRARTG